MLQYLLLCCFLSSQLIYISLEFWLSATRSYHNHKYWPPLSNGFHLFPRRLQMEADLAEGIFMSFSVRDTLTTACATNLRSRGQNLVAFLEEAFAGAKKDRFISRLVCEDFIFAISGKLSRAVFPWIPSQNLPVCSFHFLTSWFIMQYLKKKKWSEKLYF